MENITELYCFIDNFCQDAEATIHESLLNDGRRHRRRSTQLSLAALMTLVVLFHQLRFRQFKAFYLYYTCFYLRKEFPNLPSYSRFVERLPRCALALGAQFDSIKGKCTGISITNSTPLAVCDNLRIGLHKVFDGMTERGKSSTGWFFEFKIHMIINHFGEITRLRLTPRNVDDRKPLLDLIKDSFGRLYADKGYLARSLKQKLKTMGIDLITNVRRNMKLVKHSDFDKSILRRRSIIDDSI